MSAVYVYTLRDPRVPEVRYVGVTRNPTARARQHCKPERTRKGRWVQSLLNAGLKPVLEVVETTDETAWQAREQFWIAEFQQRGDTLTNGDAGGLGRLRHTEELKGKIAASLMGRPNLALSRAVFAYDALDGRLTGEYSCGREAALAVGADRANIVRAVRFGRSAAARFWSYERHESFVPPDYEAGRYVATTEHRSRLAASAAGKQLGRQFSAETRVRMSEAAKRRHARGAA